MQLLDDEIAILPAWRLGYINLEAELESKSLERRFFRLPDTNPSWLPKLNSPKYSVMAFSLKAYTNVGCLSLAY